MSYHHSSLDVYYQRDDIEEYGWDTGYEEHSDHGDYDDPNLDDGADNWDCNEEYGEDGEHNELDCAVAIGDSESLGQDLEHSKDGDDDDTSHPNLNQEGDQRENTHPDINQEGNQWKHPHPDVIQQLVMQALTEIGYT
ncbi:hypothetical protein AYO21_05059 [Fonsecaea monophora]|uniref:Uncharacterized protein n=1 Tax=Fonsecaea monophora TaxID=254056 RepID=A0A177FAM2_9EURO|nr:hypothetical protein AYO21_05059 [Fonsecaea monophora]KAH0837570.1 hypothetical protein FOPE_05238 [Fonsecaea pedrosoi]OAG40761.1 hypothetical protein AYO21_05059 [Fonsecaea monophora]